MAASKGRGRKSTDSEVEARRDRVVQMRLMRMTLPQMAEALNVDVSTVSRDLSATRMKWRKEFGVDDFDPVQAVAETIANFDFCEGRAMREYLQLDRQSETGAEHIRKELSRAMPDLVGVARQGLVDGIRDRLESLAEKVTTIARADKGRQRALVYAKLRCLQQAREAAQSRMDLLQDFGLVSRVSASAAAERGDARRIKAWMDRVHVDDAELVSEAERAWTGEAVSKTVQ